MRKIYNYTGSKSRHLEIINNIVNNIKDTEKLNYVEPFLGSGIVFLNIQKKFKKYILNDFIYSLTLFFKNYKYITKEIWNG
jgi:site-specific DNA-adenine methylase